MPPETSQRPCEPPMRVTLPARPTHPPPPAQAVHPGRRRTHRPTTRHGRAQRRPAPAVESTRAVDERRERRVVPDRVEVAVAPRHVAAPIPDGDRRAEVVDGVLRTAGEALAAGGVVVEPPLPWVG